MAKRAKSSFVTATNPMRMVRAGDLFEDDDPVIKGRESLFEDIGDYIQRFKGPERATAAPGEKRTVTMPKKRGRPPKTAPETKDDTEESK